MNPVSRTKKKRMEINEVEAKKKKKQKRSTKLRAISLKI